MQRLQTRLATLLVPVICCAAGCSLGGLHPAGNSCQDPGYESVQYVDPSCPDCVTGTTADGGSWGLKRIFRRGRLSGIRARRSEYAYQGSVTPSGIITAPTASMPEYAVDSNATENLENRQWQQSEAQNETAQDNLSDPNTTRGEDEWLSDLEAIKNAATKQSADPQELPYYDSLTSEPATNAPVTEDHPVVSAEESTRNTVLAESEPAPVKHLDEPVPLPPSEVMHQPEPQTIEPAVTDSAASQSEPELNLIGNQETLVDDYVPVEAEDHNSDPGLTDDLWQNDPVDENRSPLPSDVKEQDDQSADPAQDDPPAGPETISQPAEFEPLTLKARPVPGVFYNRPGRHETTAATGVDAGFQQQPPLYPRSTGVPAMSVSHRKAIDSPVDLQPQLDALEEKIDVVHEMIFQQSLHELKYQQEMIAQQLIQQQERQRSATVGSDRSHQQCDVEPTPIDGQQVFDHQPQSVLQSVPVRGEAAAQQPYSAPRDRQIIQNPSYQGQPGTIRLKAFAYPGAADDLPPVINLRNVSSPTRQQDSTEDENASPDVEIKTLKATPIFDYDRFEKKIRVLSERKSVFETIDR